MKNKKRTNKKRKGNPVFPLVAPISETTILCLSNDMAKGRATGTVDQWRAVARYWQHERDRLWNELGTVRCSIAVTVKGREIYNMGVNDLATWLSRQTPESTA